MNKAVFYHAGCPVCVNAEEALLKFVDTSRYAVEVVHLGEQPHRIAEAEKRGVASVPALVLHDAEVLHLNYGAALKDLKKNG